MNILLTPEEEKTVRTHPLFSGLSDADFAGALALYKAVRKTYRRDEFLKLGGDPFTAFGLLLAGSVLVCTDDLEGNPMLMAHVGRGKTFGEANCYLKKAPLVYVQAAEAADVLWLTPFTPSPARTSLETALMNRFTALLAERTLQMNDRIQILSQKTIRGKLLTFFQRYVRAEGKSFEIPFNRNTLALYLGADRAALSRELARMKQDGLIDYDGNRFKILL